jgi:hypothetical protein
LASKKPHLGEDGFGGMDPVEDPHGDVRRERDALKRQVKLLTEDLANALGGKWTAMEIGRAVREAEEARKALGWGDGELDALKDENTRLRKALFALGGKP